MKTVRIITAFFQATVPLIFFGLIGIALYVEVNSPYNLLFGLLFIFVGVFVSRFIFNMMRRRGVIEVLAGGAASYDLDNLDHLESEGIIRYEPAGLALAFQNKALEVKKGSVAIWGDFEGRGLDKKHVLQDIQFDEQSNILTIHFSDDCLVKVKNPKLIFCSQTFIKIIKAKEILWEIPIQSKTKAQFSYLNTGNRIETKSNTKWKPHKYDIGIGENALYIQG